MIKKLDWYIIKKYLSSFFFTMILISLISVVINFSENVGKFLDEELTMSQIFGEYYLNFIPWINGKLWPLFALIAVIFFTSQLAKNSEIVSVLAAGVSYRRFLVPYILTGAFVALLLWIGNNHIIPRSNRVKNGFESTYINKGRAADLGHDIHLFLNPNEKIYIRYYKKRDTSGQTFRLEAFEDDQLVSLIKARQLKFKKAPNEWTLIDYERRTFNGMSESFSSHKGESLDTILDLKPTDFLRNTHEMENLTSPELKAFIQREKDRGLSSAKKYKVELHRRTADPITIIILTLIGVAVASRKVRGGMGLHLAVGIILGATFVVLSQFSVTFSNNLTLAPSLGVWIPNFIFSVIAIVLISKAQK